MKFRQLLNAATMIFPLLAWIKHKKRLKKSKVLSIMKFHIPVSILYHLSCAFNQQSILSNILYHIDVSFIHLTSFVCSLSVINNKLFRNVTYVSSIFHLHAFLKNLRSDQSKYRFFIFIMNALPLFNYNKKRFFKLLINGAIIFPLFNNIFIYGHAYFHILLYNIYNDYFYAFSSKHNLNI